MKEFRERSSFNDGSYFILIYDGIPIDVDEEERGEIERKLRDFMNNEEIHNDVIKNIAFIRTIFIDYDEQYLYIKYHNKVKDEFVEYRNKNLTIHEVKDKTRSLHEIYKYKRNIRTSLKDIGPIGVGEDEYKLIEYYNCFFNIHPNFANNKMHIVFQCMNLILKRFGIDIINVDDYIYDEELGINISPTLDKKIIDLFPYGVIRRTGYDKGISIEEKEKIKAIGRIINDSIEGVERLKGLIKVTKLLCPKENELGNIDKLKEMNNNHSLELIKKLNGVINS